MALATLLALPAGAAAGPSVFQRGFLTDGYFRAGADDARTEAFARAKEAGATFVRINAFWRYIAPGEALPRDPDFTSASPAQLPLLTPPPTQHPAAVPKPKNFNPTDPGDSNYRWDELDRAMRESTAAGLEPVVTVVFAPPWAERSDHPTDSTRRPGTWIPSPRELAFFLTAAAQRYAGAYPDPKNPGQALPRVRYWQIWNEVNLWPFLVPQWIKRHGRWKPYAPRHYARMLAASYKALKAVHRSNRVVMAGLGPFGSRDPGTYGRVRPARFAREMFCLDAKLHRRACPDRPYLDVFSHHPYSRGGPARKALNRDDVTFPELPQLVKIFRTAARLGTARPRKQKQVWVTEFGWDTKPPDPQGVPASRQATWIDQALYVMWRAGVSRVTNVQLRDEPLDAPVPGRVPRQAGVFYSGATIFGDTPKPSFYAFRFPFVVEQGRRGRGRAWMVPPCSCQVELQRSLGSRWKTLATLRGRRDRVVLRTVVTPRGSRFRAVAVGGMRSLSVSPASL